MLFKIHYNLFMVTIFFLLLLVFSLTLLTYSHSFLIVVFKNNIIKNLLTLSLCHKTINILFFFCLMFMFVINHYLI